MATLKEFNALIRNENTQQYLVDVLGERKASFVSNLTALVSNDKKLQECEPLTIMYAALTATSLNLPLDKNLGFAYVIPYKNNRSGISEAQFQMGYKGIKQLAIRSNQFQLINATDVREGELVGRDFLTGLVQFKWNETPQRTQLPIIGYVAYFQLNNGYSKMLYMSREEVDAHAKRYSQTYNSKYESTRASSKWTTDFDAMALKTVTKLLLSKGDAPMSVDITTALAADQSVQRRAGEYIYVDNSNSEAKSQLSEIAREKVLNSSEEVDAEEVVANEEQKSENLFDNEGD